MPKVKVNDIEMYYEVHGEGTPLLLIRGWGGSSQSWSPNFIKSLSQQHRLIIFDNRGTGKTSKPDKKYSIEQMADDAARLLDATNTQKAHIVGFSMGGMIAQQFGIKYPEKTIGLVIACSRPDRNNAPVSQEAVQMMEYMISPPEGMSERDLKSMAMSLYATPEYINEHGEDLLNSLLNSKIIPTPGYVRRRQLDAIIEFSSLDSLHLIKSPTLVIHGEKDSWIPAMNSKVIAAKIPDSKLVIFEKSGHAFLEQFTDMTETILGFLKEVDV